jgi:hypothetical protein
VAGVAVAARDLVGSDPWFVSVCREVELEVCKSGCDGRAITAQPPLGREQTLRS